MARYTLEVDTGLVEVDIKDSLGRVIGTIEFNPTDSDILNRYQDVIDTLNNINVPDNVITGEDSHDERDKFYDEVREIICNQFDHLLGGDVSKGIFAKCGPFTLLNSGDYYYEHVIEGIGDLISNIMQTRMDAKLQKISEATRKYEHE